MVRMYVCACACVSVCVCVGACECECVCVFATRLATRFDWTQTTRADDASQRTHSDDACRPDDATQTTRSHDSTLTTLRFFSIFPGQGVGLGFFYAYRRSNTRTRHSMGSADLASVSFEKFRCFDGVGRIPVRQLHTPGDGHLVCVGQTISKTRGLQILLVVHRGPGPPVSLAGESVDFVKGI